MCSVSMLFSNFLPVLSSQKMDVHEMLTPGLNLIKSLLFKVLHPFQVKNKKRWSQVMYMSYVLDYKTALLGGQDN